MLRTKTQLFSSNNVAEPSKVVISYYSRLTQQCIDDELVEVIREAIKRAVREDPRFEDMVANLIKDAVKNYGR